MASTPRDLRWAGGRVRPPAAGHLAATVRRHPQPDRRRPGGAHAAPGAGPARGAGPGAVVPRTGGLPHHAVHRGRRRDDDVDDRRLAHRQPGSQHAGLRPGAGADVRGEPRAVAAAGPQRVDHRPGPARGGRADRDLPERPGRHRRPRPAQRRHRVGVRGGLPTAHVAGHLVVGELPAPGQEDRRDPADGVSSGARRRQLPAGQQPGQRRALPGVVSGRLRAGGVVRRPGGARAAAAPGAGGVLFTPWLSGERSPIDDRHARGGFHNVSLGATRADLTRAVLEGVAMNMRWLLAGAERFAGRRFDPIRMIGGGARMDVWCQIMADVCDRTIERVADPLVTGLRGAGLSVGLALGDVAAADLPGLVPVDRVFGPTRRTAPPTTGCYAQFPRLYSRNKAMFRRLNR